MKIAVLPSDSSSASAAAAIVAAGGEVVSVAEQPDGIVAHFACSVADLTTALKDAPSVRWVQLPTAGIEKWTDVIAAHPSPAWTSAKGAYAEPVAEHALTLTLAVLRDIPRRARATTWGTPSGVTLHHSSVLIVGAGGVAEQTARLFGAFGTRITVVRRQPEPVDWADRTVSAEHLDDVLPEADVVVLAAALTQGTRGVIDARRLALMKRSAVLINIARGGLVDTADLVAALADGTIAGAALDVTDPEPLPNDHPLWSEDRVLITPHTADTMEMIIPLLADRISENVTRLAAGTELSGLVDPDAGY